MSASPTPDFTGSRLGPPLYVLTRPEIRAAEELDRTERFPTRDGIVVGRKGDVAITAYGQERYPILRDVFLGAYEILGRVGSDLVAQRLIHVRRAWEVLDDGASFNYGDDRGRVPVERGSWLYQSDEGNYGTVHPKVKHAGHFEVGPEQDLHDTDWRSHVECWGRRLDALPPVLALLALSAFFATLLPGSPSWLSPGLLGLEVVLLLGGAAIVARMKLQRWALKACVQTSLELGREFQAAVRLLGQADSAFFPGMALWRAVQTEPGEPRADEVALLQSLESTAASRLRALGDATDRAHRREKAASWVTLAAFVLMLFSTLSLLFIGHALTLEFIVIWLPTLIAAVHGFDQRRRTAERVGAIRTFADQLCFAHTRLFETERMTGPARNAVLGVLCRSAAAYGQHELRLALAVDVRLPV